jgi:3-(3-hydroxy-phenyl)propionate hydroxylase
VVDGAPVRLFELMHDARPLLLGLGGRAPPEPAAAVPRLRRVDARFSGALDLPVIGVVATPKAVLVRPDGHVAWVAESDDPAGLSTALEAWCGLQPPRSFRRP